MKKLTFFLATIFPIAALAVTEQSKDTKQQADESHIYLSIFDRTQMPSVDLHKKEISRSNKNEKVCWIATGDFRKTVNVTETFKAQAKSQMEFNDATNGQITSSPNKKTHSITYTAKPLENGKYVTNCWEFGRWDPTGKYVLTVKIGKHEFEKQVFYVTE